MLRPVDVPVLDAQHLTLAAARFERADDPVVHGGSDPLVLGRAHRRACCQERLFFLAVDSAIPLRLVASPDAHAEAMERAGVQQRRILESSPVDRSAKY